jgi:hypothetical protein|tara:strand:- start:329 stop:541 length:213 start_codon:yes stop_codon:yes gene_type:complete
MATQSIEKVFVHFDEEAFEAVLKDNPDVKKAIEDILHDNLVDEGWDISSVLGFKASFDVTFIQETFEDEE